ncbi:hypothetical protein VPH35_044475 [Triticum aestivum]
MRRQGGHQPEPRRRPLLILLAAADWIESAHMASPPLPPGFASRRMESPWPPRGVALAAAESQLHHCPQESGPGKVTSSESLLSLVLLRSCPACCMCVVCVWPLLEQAQVRRLLQVSSASLPIFRSPYLVTALF